MITYDAETDTLTIRWSQGGVESSEEWEPGVILDYIEGHPEGGPDVGGVEVLGVSLHIPELAQIRRENERLAEAAAYWRSEAIALADLCLESGVIASCARAYGSAEHKMTERANALFLREEGRE